MDCYTTAHGYFYNMDCLKYLRTTPADMFDMVCTDPPYMIEYKTGHRQQKGHEFSQPIMNDACPELLPEFFRQCFRILKPNTALYTFCSWKTDQLFREALINAGFTIKNNIIWVKNNWSGGDLTGAFGQQYENILFAAKGRPLLHGKRLTDVRHHNRVVGKTQMHQNQKPTSLIRELISSFTAEEGMVFDGFAGSCTTGVVCERMNRNWVACEIDPREYTKATLRLDQELKGDQLRLWNA